ncbi:hypothetical protein ACWDTD_04615 [Gordonia sp. NPDC003425]
MSIRGAAKRFVAHVPFGIGTVTLILSAALVATVGVVLSIGTPTSTATYDNGQLRSYPRQPDVAWTVADADLPGYQSASPIEVADSHGDRWLLAYPSGIGRAFVMVDRYTGRRVWSAPVVVGLGACAFDGSGGVGCALKLGQAPDGFYSVDDTGRLGARLPLDDTAQVIGVGADFLRIDQAGYRVSMRSPSGRSVWNRTFAAAATASFSHGILLISTADGNEFVVDPSDGTDEITCAGCDIRRFASGITVSHNTFGAESVTTYAVVDGTVSRRPTARQPDSRVLGGASILPVIAGTGIPEMEATQGQYEVRDPARGKPLWQITDPELSKANTRPCGTMVAFARKDRSREVYRLRDGTRVGALPVPSLDEPDANIDSLRCVGSSGDLVVFANADQLTAFDPAQRRIAWRRPLLGQTRVVDGYIVVTQGTSLSVLRPG